MSKTAGTHWHSAQASSLTALPRPVYFRSYHIPCGTHVEAHRHAWSQFIYARAGVMHIQAEGSRSLIPPLYGVWIPGGMLHEAWTLEDVDLESLFIEPAQLEARRQECNVVLVSDFARAFIHHANSSIAEQYDIEGKEGRMLAVLLDVLQALPNAAFHLPQPAHAAMAAMCQAMQKDPGAPHLQEGWAKQLHMSPRTFSRRFQEETGLAFSAWRQRLRLLNAIMLLKSGRTVTDVALELGYNSPSAFAHAFSAMFGASPRQFLKQ